MVEGKAGDTIDKESGVVRWIRWVAVSEVWRWGVLVRGGLWIVLTRSGGLLSVELE